MRHDLGCLTVKSLIVHEVPSPRGLGATDGPTLSEIETILTQELRNFFKERIAKSLRIAAYEVEFDPETTSPVPGLLSEALGVPATSLVDSSQDLARHLHQCQTARNPGGLLAVAEVGLADRRGLCILKLEKEEGARVRTEVEDGKTRISVDHIRDLMLTQNTKIFKVALFLSPGPEAEASIEGLVSDKQKPFGNTVADFFLRQFLGCRLRDRPDVVTRRFLEAAERFVNEEVTDPADKTQYQIAVVAELNSSRSQVMIPTFVQDHLKTEHRQLFETAMREQGFDAPSFAKDTTLVRSRLRLIRYDFESGVSVLASPDHIGQQVKVEQLPDERTRIEVVDRLKGMHGRNR